jgi:hypothetical protein
MILEMAEHGDIVYGANTRAEVAAEIEGAKLAAARRHVEKKRKELETVNQVRKVHGKRPLTLEEYMAIDAPAAPKVPTLETHMPKPTKKHAIPYKFGEPYIELVKLFLKNLDTGSEEDVKKSSKPVYFHHFSLAEFKDIVNKASDRLLLSFLFSLVSKLEMESRDFAMEANMTEKIWPFRTYVNEKTKVVAEGIKERDEKAEQAAAEAARRAEEEASLAALKAKAEEEARKAAAAAAAEATAAARAGDPYRRVIVDYTEAQEKAGRANVAARGRAIRLRAALEKYNRTGEAIPEDLLSSKIKKELKEKGAAKGGRRTRRNARK